jgi:hypothetical protein
MTPIGQWTLSTCQTPLSHQGFVAEDFVMSAGLRILMTGGVESAHEGFR